MALGRGNARLISISLKLYETLCKMVRKILRTVVGWLDFWTITSYVCFLCSKQLRMIPIFRGCFYLRPSYHKVDKILGVCQDYVLAINVCESPPRLLTLSNLQVKKEWFENIVCTPEIQHGTPKWRFGRCVSFFKWVLVFRGGMAVYQALLIQSCYEGFSWFAWYMWCTARHEVS